MRTALNIEQTLLYRAVDAQTIIYVWVSRWAELITDDGFFNMGRSALLYRRVKAHDQPTKSVSIALKFFLHTRQKQAEQENIQEKKACHQRFNVLYTSAAALKSPLGRSITLPIFYIQLYTSPLLADQLLLLLPKGISNMYIFFFCLSTCVLFEELSVLPHSSSTF